MEELVLSCYKDLRVWKQAVNLALEIYRSTYTFPKHEQYGLVSQMRRASVSVASNIAEGKGRSSDKEFVLFLHHARGSLLELETQLLIAAQLHYLGDSDADQLFKLAEGVAKMLNGLINSLRKKEAA